MSKRFAYSRYSMYTHIQEFFNSVSLKSGKCLIIGDSLRGRSNLKVQIQEPALYNMLPKGCEVVAPAYPDVDMQKMFYKDNTFDYVLTDQVLEHVRKPWVGVKEIWRVLKPGGIAVITSALLFPIHGVPYDYFRFTPDGLRVLCEKFSKIHRCSGTGNRKFALNIIGKTKPGTITPGTPLEKEALASDGTNTVSVWIIAEK